MIGNCGNPLDTALYFNRLKTASWSHAIMGHASFAAFGLIDESGKFPEAMNNMLT
jgi:hypothetical protein